MFTASRHIVVALLFLLPLTSAAQMCKWVDEAGSVHYAERCPDSVESQSVVIEAPPSQERAESAAKAYDSPAPTTAELSASEGGNDIEFVRREQSLSINPDDIHCPSASRVSFVRKMDGHCDAAREAHIAPFRQDAIDECIRIQMREQSYCEQHFADFLDPTWVGRLDSPRAFDFLPECQIAYTCRSEAGLPDRDQRYPWWVAYRWR